jgi:hypothetical protein
VIRRPTEQPPALPEAGMGPPSGPPASQQLFVALAALGLGILGLGYWRLRLEG